MMLETAAVDNDLDTDRGTGGLDKIFECDDEGGGEQVEGFDHENERLTC